MRLVPVAGGGTVRVTDRPIVLGGYAIPAGVQIGVPLHGAPARAKNPLCAVLWLPGCGRRRAGAAA